MSQPCVPSYRHHRPSGQAVVTLDGRDLCLGDWKTKASRIGYKRLIGEWLSDGRPRPSLNDKADLRIWERVADCLAFAMCYYVDDGAPGKEYLCMKAAAQPLVELDSRKASCQSEDWTHGPVKQAERTC